MSLGLKAPDLAVFGGRVLSGISSLSSVFTMTTAGSTVTDFPVDAISFNGTSSYIQYTNNFFRDTDMRYTETGNAFTLSFWFKPNLSPNSAERIIDVRAGATNQVYSVYLRTNGISPTPQAYLNIQYEDDNSNLAFARTPLNDNTIVDSAWNHCLYSAKQLGATNDFEHNFAINDTVLTATDTDSGDIGNTPTATTNTAIGKIEGGSGYYDGCLSEVWMKDVYYDLSVESNRRLFIGANSKPVDPPASPLVYLNGSASTWTNDGSSDLGTQTLNNITDCADSPSD